MTRHEARHGAVGGRDVLQRWPLVLAVALVAVAASLLALAQRAPEYTAGTRLVVTPLPQYDETFLGTSLARDGSDAGRTASTVAGLLESARVAGATASTLGGGLNAESVAAAVDVATVEGTNLVEVVARASDPDQAAGLARAFTAAAVADRWQTIVTELDARIALLAPATDPDPNAGEASQWLAQLRLIRAGGVDPTVRVDGETPAERVPQLPGAVVGGLAALGGLFLGVLVAVGIAVLRRRPVGADGTSQPGANGVAPARPELGERSAASISSASRAAGPHGGN